MKTKKTFLTTLFMTLFLAVLILGVRPVTAEAKTVKVKKQKYTTEFATIKKKAKAVKKGTTTLKVSPYGYIKFKAPSTKKYTFTFSGQKSNKDPFNNGYAYILLPKEQSNGSIYMEQQKFSTTGGKATTAWFHSAKYASTDKTTGAFLAKRSCKLKLKKGTTYYLYLYFATNGSVKLKIK